MGIDAIFFDIDGTLVDSNEQHVSAYEEAFAQVGASFPRQEIHDQIGKGSDMLLPVFMPDADEAQQEAIGKAQVDIYMAKYLPDVRPFPGARDLLQRAYDIGQKVVLASSASKACLEHYLDLLAVRDIVAATTSADDVEHTKPAPDIFAAALAKLAPLTPGQTIVVGDTPYDIQAAAKCGIGAIGVRSGKFSDAVLLEAGAIALYDDVAALLADYEQSPLRC